MDEQYLKLIILCLNKLNITNPLFWVGTITSAMVGLASIGFLLKYLQHHNFAVFAGYRLVLAAIITIVYLTQGT
ncbi:undecaprenyl-diphosphate phosphatase [Anaerospora hongkongensis]|uniref:undecaprenyl-diphosphate phosphatase n=1 Tax=Anaerospora hongkongensis TaxID=244830 RepID=UPI00243664A7|nr:undecaprenyl-diphosphate phosphatase [Anaerospora hongkongensis]